MYSSYIIKEKGVNVIMEADENIVLKIDENLIERTFVNIIINAAQSVQNFDGVIKIKSFEVSAQEGENEGIKYVCTVFEDNGGGFTDEALKKIFTPFFSTKKSGGTGLGLSIALNNVILHGGYINAENLKETGGAKISVFLPYMA